MKMNLWGVGIFLCPVKACWFSKFFIFYTTWALSFYPGACRQPPAPPSTSVGLCQLTNRHLSRIRNDDAGRKLPLFLDWQTSDLILWSQNQISETLTCTIFSESRNDNLKCTSYSTSLVTIEAKLLQYTSTWLASQCKVNILTSSTDL